MCDPVTTIQGVGLAASLLGGLAGGKPQAPAAPQTPEAPPKPQAASTPAQTDVRRNNRAAQAGTLLTGATGVAPSLLTTGKNTLLGA